MKFLVGLLLGSSVIFGAVDLNTANIKELSSLKGVGTKKAEAIISYREANCFDSIVELEKVKGIGKKTVAKNRDNLTVSECK